jgi:hypothetical protein
MFKMTDKQLIGELRKLRQIKPRKDWVVFTKTQILGSPAQISEKFMAGREPKFTLFPYLKPAFAGLIAAFALIGVVGFSLNSLPGDILYPVKKIAEKSQAVFVSIEEKPAFKLKLANERLEDLTKAEVKNLAPAISEFQSSISEAAKNLAKIDATTSDPGVIKKIAEETKKLEENREKVKSLGVVVEGKETEEFSNALSKIVNSLIEDLEETSLTEEKEEILDEMKKLIGEEKYSEALELYLINQ